MLERSFEAAKGQIPGERKKGATLSSFIGCYVDSIIGRFSLIFIRKILLMKQVLWHSPDFVLKEINNLKKVFLYHKIYFFFIAFYANLNTVLMLRA